MPKDATYPTIEINTALISYIAARCFYDGVPISRHYAHNGENLLNL